MRKKVFNAIEGTFDIIGGEHESCLLALAAGQVNLNVNDVVELVDNVANVTVNNNVTFNNTTHRATLKSGKTYKLQAYVRHDGSATNTAANYRWYDVTNSVWIGQDCQISSQDAILDDGVQPTASAIITPSTNIEVELRCAVVSTANQHLHQDATHAIIEKLKEDIYNVVSTPSMTEENCLLALSVDQTSLGVGTVINLLDNVIDKTINNNTLFSNGTHQATLKAGKTYKLQASFRVLGTGSNDAIYFRWYNVTTSSYIGVTGITASLTHISNNGASPTACAIISPTVDIQVDLRVSGIDGTPNILENTAWASIEKIADRVLTQATVGSTDEMLKRADNDAFETAQAGVEYYAPTQHGRIFGIVYRRYYAIPDAGGAGDTQNIALGFTISGRVVDLRGIALNQAGDQWQPMPFVDYGSTNRNIELKAYPTIIQIIGGAGQDWQAGGYIWIDYTK